MSKHGKARKTAVPSEVAASVRYAVSQRLRKRIEEGFGWTKTVGGLTQVKVRGLAKIRAAFVFAMAAYNRPPAQAPGPEGRSASGGLKSQRTMTRKQARTSKMSRISRQKIAPALPGCANAVTFSAACSRTLATPLAATTFMRTPRGSRLGLTRSIPISRQWRRSPGYLAGLEFSATSFGKIQIIILSAVEVAAALFGQNEPDREVPPPHVSVGRGDYSIRGYAGHGADRPKYGGIIDSATGKLLPHPQFKYSPKSGEGGGSGWNASAGDIPPDVLAKVQAANPNLTPRQCVELVQATMGVGNVHDWRRVHPRQIPRKALRLLPSVFMEILTYMPMAGQERRG